MTDTPARQPGWYADPQQPGELRYWTGSEWGQQFKGSKLPQAQRRDRGVPLGRGFFVLASVVSLGLQAQVIVFLARIWLYVWGLTIFDDAVETGDLHQLNEFDDLDRITSIATLVLLVGTGITWMVWQYQLARSTRLRELRRGPGWHAFSWITPVVGLWFPYQNLHDLWRRRFGDSRTALLGWWWAAWLTGELLSRVFLSRTDDIDSVSAFDRVVGLDIAVSVFSVIGLVLAVIIQRALTRAEALGPTPAGSLAS